MKIRIAEVRKLLQVHLKHVLKPMGIFEIRCSQLSILRMKRTSKTQFLFFIRSGKGRGDMSLKC